MMKNILLIAIVASFSYCNAQNIGIGTTNPEAVLHVDSKRNTVTGLSNTQYDDMVITSTGKLGVGTVTPKTKADFRSNENLNEVGVGTTQQTAVEAKMGALRYNSATKDLSYSDGTNWINLSHKSPNDFVDATNASQQSFANNATTTITGWTANTDVNNSFTPNTGIFKASKAGVYIVNFNYTLESSLISSNSRIEAIIQTNSTLNATIKSFKCVGSYPGNNTFSNKISGGCSGIFNVNAGDEISVSLLNGLGGSKKLDANSILTSINIFGL